MKDQIGTEVYAIGVIEKVARRNETQKSQDACFHTPASAALPKNRGACLAYSGMVLVHSCSRYPPPTLLDARHTVTAFASRSHHSLSS
jgi:hypothetical protein